MKNLSNIKSALAVSMLLSASLFSSHYGCSSKLADEILSKDARANVGGRASFPGQCVEFQQAPLPAKGIIVIGGTEKDDGIIIETGRNEKVVQGGLQAARANLDYFVALDDALRARRVAEYAAFDMYNSQRLNNGLVSEFFGVSCPKARANFVECLSEVKRNRLFTQLRQAEIDASEDLNVIAARKSIAKQERNISFLKAEQSLLDRAEKENSRRIDAAEHQLKMRNSQLLADLQSYPDYNLVSNDPCVEKTTKKSGFTVTAFVKSKKFDVDAFENALSASIKSDRLGRREPYHATLKMRIAEIRETQSQMAKLSERATDLSTRKSKVIGELCVLKKEKAYAETHMMHNVIYSAARSLDLKQLNASAIEYEDLREQKRVPYRTETEKSLHAHTATGYVLYAEKAVDTKKAAFLENIRDSKELSFRAEHAAARANFADMIRHSDDVSVSKARVDLIAAQVDSMKPEDASVFLGREIAYLERELIAHEKNDAKVHAEMGKKAPAAPQGLFARLCFWK